MEFDVTKLSDHIYVAAYFILGCIGGGALFLLIYFHDFFIYADNFRLSLIALSIISPLFILNSAFVGISTKGTTFDQTVRVGAFLTIPVLYIPIVLGFFFHLVNRTGILIVFGIEVIYCIVSLIMSSVGNDSTK